jgi:hypothetical protein
VQKIWVTGQWAREREHARFADAPEASARAEAEKSPILVFLGDTLSVLHYALPKTHDADVLTKKLRTIVAGKGSVVRDDAIHLVVADDPSGYRLATDRGSVDLSKTPARWIGEGSSEITLSRRSRTNEAGSSSRRGRQSTSQAATELVKTLENSSSIVAGSLTRESPDSMQLLSEIVRWNETGPAGSVGRQHAFIGVDDWMVEVDVRQPGADAQSLRDKVEVLRFMMGVRVEKDDVSFLGQEEWYEKRFGWTAPLRFNAFFSLLSSIAFAALMLGISAWRLSRIDF